MIDQCVRCWLYKSECLHSNSGIHVEPGIVACVHNACVPPGRENQRQQGHRDTGRLQVNFTCSGEKQKKETLSQLRQKARTITLLCHMHACHVTCACPCTQTHKQMSEIHFRTHMTWPLHSPEDSENQVVHFQVRTVGSINFQIRVSKVRRDKIKPGSPAVSWEIVTNISFMESCQQFTLTIGVQCKNNASCTCRASKHFLLQG